MCSKHTQNAFKKKNEPVLIAEDLGSSPSLESPTRPQSTHLPPSRSLSFRRVSDHLSRRFRDSTCSRLRVTSSKKLSSTRRVISYMAALKTVSITPESCDWKVTTASDITSVSSLSRYPILACCAQYSSDRFQCCHVVIYDECFEYLKLLTL